MLIYQRKQNFDLMTLGLCDTKKPYMATYRHSSTWNDRVDLKKKSWESSTTSSGIIEGEVRNAKNS